MNCGNNVTVPSCSTQAQVTSAWEAFRASTSASGGCNGVLTVSKCPAPSPCGGYVDVTWTYTVAACGETGNTITCTRRFTVASTSDVVFHCGTDVTVPSCSTPDQLNSAWNAFLASTTASGGCNGVFSRTSPNSPSPCGGSVEVTWTYTATACGGQSSTQTCTRTFTVSEPTPTVFTPGNNVTLPACSTQAQVTAAWNAFLSSANATGGCGGVLTNTATNPPSLCGGSVNVTFVYTSRSCGQSCGISNVQEFTRTFTILASPPVVLTCPANIVLPAAGQTQSQIAAAYTAWLATATASGGCNGVLTNNAGAAPICGVSKTVTFTYTSTCAPLTTTCTATFTAPPCARLEGCTLGYWKNHTDRWCGAYRTCDRFGNVFTSAPAILANLTLLQALNIGGGGIYNLARQGAAALLNTCSGEVAYAGYGDNPLAVIAAVNQAYSTGETAAGILGSQLDVLNNSGCPLGGTSATTASNCTSSSNPVGKAATTFEAVVSPNPYSDNFNVNLSTSSDDKVSISVYDMVGKLIDTREVSPKQTTEVKIGDKYPSGVYNLIVTQGKDVKTLRVIKR